MNTVPIHDVYPPETECWHTPCFYYMSRRMRQPWSGIKAKTAHRFPRLPSDSQNGRAAFFSKQYRYDMAVLGGGTEKKKHFWGMSQAGPHLIRNCIDDQSR